MCTAEVFLKIAYLAAFLHVWSPSLRAGIRQNQQMRHSSSIAISTSFYSAALWSGTCGALASSLAKITFSSTSLFVLSSSTKDVGDNGLFNAWGVLFLECSSFFAEEDTDDNKRHPSWFWWWFCWLGRRLPPPEELMVRLLCFVAMIGCNLLAVSTFVQGLQDAGSISGTALTTAANCLVSILLGIVVWQDPIVPSNGWGLLCILLGLFILLSNNHPSNLNTPDEEGEKEKKTI